MKVIAPLNIRPNDVIEVFKMNIEFRVRAYEELKRKVILGENKSCVRKK